MESSYLGAYWGSRPESSRECGDRLAHCLAALAAVDDVLRSWYRRGARKAAARIPIEPAAESLSDLLRRGANRRDFGGEVIEELGFTVGLWNRAHPVVGLSATVGAHPTFQGVLNSLVLEFPPFEEGGMLYEPERAAAIVKAVVEAWEPEWASWTTQRLREAQLAGPREPVVGWMTYLRGNVPEELSLGAIRGLADGFLLQAAPEFGAANEEALLTIRQHLQQLSALHPIP